MRRDLLHNITLGNLGTLPIANGGTGSTSTTYASLTANVTGILPVANGGLGTGTIGTANQIATINAGATAINFLYAINQNIQTVDKPTFAGVILTSPARLKGYTVATLPAGTVGDVAYVTDALAPTFLATVVGGGAVTTPVFYNGASWVGS